MKTPGHVTKVTTSKVIDQEPIRRLKAVGSTTRRNIDGVLSMLEHVKVTVEYNPHEDDASASYAWTSFAAACWGDEGTGGGADALSSVTLLHVVKSGTVELLALGGVMDSYELSCRVGEKLQAVAEFICADLTACADLSASGSLDFSNGLTHSAYPTGDPLTFKDCDEVVVSSTTQTFVTGWSIKWENNSEERFRLAGGSESNERPADIQPGGRLITGKFTLDFATITHYEEFASTTEVTSCKVVVGAKTITLNYVHFGQIEIPSSPEDLISVDVPFTAESFSVA